MRAIVTTQNDDGTFSECGMNTRTILGPYQRESFILKRAREFAKGKPHRVEFFGSNIHVKPFKTTIITPETLTERVTRLIANVYATQDDMSLDDKLFKQIIAERIYDDL